MMDIVTPEQRQIARAALHIARDFGIGGSRWTVARATGDGVSAAVATVSAGIPTAWIRRVQPSRITATLPGTQTDDTTWHLFADMEAEQAVTFQNTGDTVTRTAHGLVANQVVILTGVVAGTYYILNPTANTLQLSATLGGTVVPIPADGSGTLTLIPFLANDLLTSVADPTLRFVIQSLIPIAGYIRAIVDYAV